MDEFQQILFSTLRQMDMEAGRTASGVPTGLSWYGGFLEPSKKRPRTEVCWSRRLAQLLPQYGYPAKAEVAYPGQRHLKCDIACVSAIWRNICLILAHTS